MPNLLSKLSGISNSKPIEPREIFMSLPMKDKRYEYPRDVQTDVWKKWFVKRNQKNTIIKMNTGSGKTVVGLMMLQSCLNEDKGPAVYVVPDNFLVAQVCAEADMLGIKAVIDENDYDYSSGQAILVINIHKLVNGKSIFGMKSSGSNYPIGSVLMDDVHACLDTIKTQFSLQIPSSHSLYSDLISIFGDAWKTQNPEAYADIIELNDPIKNAMLPFWIWQDKHSEIYKLLKRYEKEDDKLIIFNLPLIREIIKLCSCVITSRGIEITPKGIPMEKISSFNDASRRIFMSATLADDSVFVSAIGLKPNSIDEIITPDTANDIGDRLMLFPRHLNNKISDEDIRGKIISLSEVYNVVVIVPSFEQAKLWESEKTRIANKDTIEEVVAELKNRHLGLAVLVNRYDGIDLPDDACRILVIDGLPPLRSEYDKYLYSINPTSKILLREQMQKIEQGMGRGVRSSNDSCCIIFMGDRLADVLIRNRGIDFFSNATITQYNLSKELWDLLKKEKKSPLLDDIFELSEYSLDREKEWITRSKQRLSSVVYNSELNIDKETLALRDAFEFASIGDFQKIIIALDTVIRNERDDRAKGLLNFIKAEYTNLFDHSMAQQVLKAARSFNSGVTAPIAGIQYKKQINNKTQATSVLEYLHSVSSDPNECILHINSVLDDLVFNPNADAGIFELALQEVGTMLGFKSSRPDKEGTGGPDNLWAIGNNKYFVIECKSGATSNFISKEYCNQLGGSIRWFINEYGNDYTSAPIMVHPSNVLHELATPPQNMRVMIPPKLEIFKGKILGFFAALVQSNGLYDETQISSLLASYMLRSSEIIENCTVSVKTNN